MQTFWIFGVNERDWGWESFQRIRSFFGLKPPAVALPHSTHSIYCILCSVERINRFSMNFNHSNRLVIDFILLYIELVKFWKGINYEKLCFFACVIKTYFLLRNQSGVRTESRNNFWCFFFSLTTWFLVTTRRSLDLHRFEIMKKIIQSQLLPPERKHRSQRKRCWRIESKLTNEMG